MVEFLGFGQFNLGNILANAREKSMLQQWIEAGKYFTHIESNVPRYCREYYQVCKCFYNSVFTIPSTPYLNFPAPQFHPSVILSLHSIYFLHFLHLLDDCEWNVNVSEMLVTIFVHFLSKARVSASNVKDLEGRLYVLSDDIFDSGVSLIPIKWLLVPKNHWW